MKLECKCGCKTFYGTQYFQATVIVDDDGCFESTIPLFNDAGKTISGSEGMIKYDCDIDDPFGPYTCTSCGAVFGD